jgi:hypothetical protein
MIPSAAALTFLMEGEDNDACTFVAEISTVGDNDIEGVNISAIVLFGCLTI